MSKSDINNYFATQTLVWIIREGYFYKDAEREKIEKFLRPDDNIIALCIEGKQITKEELKKSLIRMQEQNSGRMVFLIGGSLGLWDKLIKKAQLKLSFSKMTFPHQLMRVMLTEVICQL